MKAKIGLEEMRFKSFHGYYAEEELVGGEYLLSVWIEYFTDKRAPEDTLEEVINYENLYSICARVMSIPRKLIETVAQDLQQEILEKWWSIESMKIVLKKLNPPLAGPTACASVELNYST